MRPSLRWRRLALRGALAALLGLAIAGPGRRAVAQEMPEGGSRQVTVFGILATPGDKTVDKRLKGIEPQLRQLLPDHGFRLLEVQSKRLMPGQAVACTKLRGYVAEVGLLVPVDPNGKVQLRFALGTRSASSPGLSDGPVEMQAATIVTTPPNQLSFFDKPTSDGARLLIGLGAR